MAAGEGLGVLRQVRAFVLPTVDRNRSGQHQEGADQRVLPERALGQEAGMDRQGLHQQQRVDQAVDVVGDQDEGAAARDALGSHHLDLPEEGLEDEAGEAEEDGGGWGQRRTPARA